jgi:AcrR family transcriptional regulator
MTAAAPRRVVSRLPRARREKDIMDAAHAVFAERGHENAAMSEIAARAGIVEGTIYKYFESKRDLLYRVMGRWYEAMVVDYETELAGIKGTRNRLHYIIWRHLKSVQENPSLCRLFFREVRVHDDYYDTHIYEMNRRYTRFAVQVVREGMATGELKPDLDVAVVRDMIYGCIEHHVWNFVRGRGTLDSEASAEAITGMLMGGIGATAPQARAPASLAGLDGLIGRLERAVERAELAAGGE